MPVRTSVVQDNLPDGVMSIATILGDNIRTYRLLEKMGQENLAEKMRNYRHPWWRATVSEIERARRNVTIAELLALALIFRVSLSELLDPAGLVGYNTSLKIGFPVVFSSENFSTLICTHRLDSADVP